MAKGRAGEQWVGRWLYQVWYGVAAPRDREVFVRVGLGRHQPTGDLIVPDDFPCLVEVKNKVYDILRDKELREVAMQLFRAAQRYRRPYALVFFRRAKRQWHVLVASLTLTPWVGEESWVHFGADCLLIAIPLQMLERCLTKLKEGDKDACAG